MKHFFWLSLMGFFAILSCEKQDALLQEEQADLQQSDTGQIVDQKKLILDFIAYCNEGKHKKQILSQLSKRKIPMALTPALAKMGSSNSFAKLKKDVDQLEQKEELEIMEMWLHNPKGKMNVENLLVTYAPDNSENLKTVKAYDLKGREYTISTNTAPDQAVIVFEKNGYHTLHAQVAEMNEKLKKSNLKSSDWIEEMNSREAGVAIATTKLDKIELKDDKEPWIKGGAEIYAITSGIKDSQNNPELNILPMYYLDQDNTAYYPNQIILTWDTYKYKAANIHFFEKDDNHNYQNLISVIIGGVTQVAGTLSGQPWVNALGGIGTAIVEAMPSHWFTDDDDLVDSFYTIEKDKTYKDYFGVSNNAKIDLSPFQLEQNVLP